MTASARPPTLHTLQIGMEWFPEIPGGVNRLFYEVVRRLPDNGVAVRGIVAGSPRVGSESGGVVEAAGDVTDPLPVRWWRFRAGIRRALAGQQDTLVASHFALYTLAALDVVRRHPLVIHFHGPWAHESKDEGAPWWSTRMRAAMERAVYRHGALHIVLSVAFARVLHDAYGVPEARIRIVPGGVDVNRFAGAPSRSEARERLGWPGDRPIVFAVRRLVRRMGLENLLEAVADVRRRVPSVMLFVAGAGPLGSELQARIDAAGLEGSVRLLDRVPDDTLPLAYRAADLTIVPSVALEGFGLVVAESLAAGTPVLVTPVGGLPEAVGALSPDLVLAGSTPEALAEGLTQAITGSRRLPDRGACIDFARACYDWSTVCTRIVDVYREARG